MQNVTDADGDYPAQPTGMIETHPKVLAMRGTGGN